MFLCSLLIGMMTMMIMVMMMIVMVLMIMMIMMMMMMIVMMIMMMIMMIMMMMMIAMVMMMMMMMMNNAAHLSNFADRAFSRELLTHAKSIYTFAKNHQGFYSTSVNDAAAYYRFCCTS